MKKREKVTGKSKIVKVASKVSKAKPGVTAVAKVGSGFLDFIRTQGVVGLAVGLVLGSSISTMVKSLVDDVVMPPLGLLLGSAEGLKGLSVTIESGDKSAVLQYGNFLNDFINFLIIAFVVYLIVKLLRVENLDKKKS